MTASELHSSIPSSILNRKLLVVDDAALNRELIVSYLEKANFSNIDTASDGQEALEKIETFSPDLVILDLVMPGLNGFEVIKRMRAIPRHQRIPIIVQTTISEPEQRIEAWCAGANDVITKPIHRLELLSRIQVQLKNTTLLRELETYHNMAKEDIYQALELQRSLLPTSDLILSLEEKHQIKIDSLFMPSRFLSGDMWGVIDISNHQMGLWICDFSGKGIRAALNVFRIHTIIHEYQHCADEPIEIMDALNNRLVDLLTIGQFATFLFGVIDFKANSFSYSAASSTHPILYFPHLKKYQLGDGSGLPLGLVANQKFPLKHLPFDQGNSLVLYSDLLWEQKALPGISLREEDLDSFIDELNGQPFVETIRRQLELLTDTKLVDDLTLVEIKRN
ncbi:MAG: fused response regulator/phosphatase [Proteobacteria bacterium]|nr:fused response regulator/phosphatase [Pseudomonadota bacterium]